jgi:hypothetical protein
MREIMALARQLDIDPAVLLLMAREAGCNARLRCVEELTADGKRELLTFLREMSAPRLLAA